MEHATRLSMRLGLLAGLMLWGCGDDDDGETGIGITEPTIEKGPGRIYRAESVSFPTIDGVQIGALFGRVEPSSFVDDSGAEADEDPTTESPPPRPVVILVHDLTLDSQQWFNTPIFLELLERGYVVLAIDLRGHGASGLPEGHFSVDLEDLENGYLDIRAALTWLKSRSEADAARVAVVGSGVGGNVAYVSMGAFPLEIRTAVALSPGIFDPDFRALVVGAGLEEFAPHTMLFMAGSEDSFQAQNQTVLFASFASFMAGTALEPRRLIVVPGSSAHGVDLLADDQAAESFFAWLEEHL